MKTKKIFTAACMAICCIWTSCTPQPQTTSEAEPTTTENLVVKTIMARRSIRNYKPEPVSREQMDTILMCGINAPSAMNRQTWEVCVVDNPEFINGITNLFRESAKGDEEVEKMVNDPAFRNMFRNAPTVAFIAAPIGASHLDCGLLVENMLIAAQSMNIGSCSQSWPVQFLKTPAAAAYLQQLNFSPEYEVILAVGFGYPNESPEAKPRDNSKVRYLD